MLRDADLLATLHRRVEGQRLAAALGTTAIAKSALFKGLRKDDEVVAAAAAALIARTGRRDADAPLVARTDLSADQRQTLVWRVGAALAHYMLARAALPPAVVDRAMIAAVNAALAGYDEGETIEARALHLARRLHRQRRIDDAIVRAAIEEGQLALAVAFLAVRAGLDYGHAWDMAVAAGGSRLLVLLRAIGCDRAEADRIVRLLGAAEGISEDDVALRMEAFDRLAAAAARDAIRPFQLDSGYGRALADLSAGLGGGSRR